jgi:hypothetical protein
MSARSTVLLCLALLSPPVGARAASGPETVRIEITSSWGGLGPASEGHLLITGTHGKYRSGGGRISPSAVESLLSALQQPTVDDPSLEQCGLTADWLLTNYKPALEEITYKKISNLPPKAVALFQEHFTGASSAQAAFAELFKNWHTDDFPKMSVMATVDGKNVGVESNSQHPFMLPWMSTGKGQGGYNCAISQAIAVVLPKKFSNRDRLLPLHSFRWDFAQQVMESIRPQWDLLDTEFRVGPDVAPIFAHFNPLKSAIGNLSSIDLDGETAWNAELQSPELPKNMIIGVSLRYSKGKLNGADQFTNNVSKYSNLVIATPLLSNYLQGHQDATIELRYVDGRSLSPKAEASLTEDLRTHNKPELADLVSKQGADSAFLEVNAGSGCWSRAIVFPSKEVLLWHFKCDSTLGFPAKDFDSWDYYGWRSTGTLVRADGTLAK